MPIPNASPRRIALGLLLLATCAHAAADTTLSRFYGGAAIGVGNQDVSAFESAARNNLEYRDVKSDEYQPYYKLFFGVRPSSLVDLELFLSNLGTFKTRGSNSAVENLPDGQYSTRATALGGDVRFKLGSIPSRRYGLVDGTTPFVTIGYYRARQRAGLRVGAFSSFDTSERSAAKLGAGLATNIDNDWNLIYGMEYYDRLGERDETGAGRFVAVYVGLQRR